MSLTAQPSWISLYVTLNQSERLSAQPVGLRWRYARVIHMYPATNTKAIKFRAETVSGINMAF